MPKRPLVANFLGEMVKWPSPWRAFWAAQNLIAVQRAAVEGAQKFGAHFGEISAEPSVHDVLRCHRSEALLCPSTLFCVSARVTSHVREQHGNGQRETDIAAPRA